VEITIMNQLHESTTVHWHGMELESYYDGVAYGTMSRQFSSLRLANFLNRLADLQSTSYWQKRSTH
jgi:FtsP/CotA-like multicopper oxidase with cupredoxin domain